MTRHATGAELVARTRRHNFFSWSAQDAINPIPFVRAEGVYFWDADGKRYFDLNSQSMCVNIGHGDPRVVEAIQAQAATLTYAGPGMATPIRAELGEALAAVTPSGLDKFFFTLGGSDANENAVKLARRGDGAAQDPDPLPGLSWGDLRGSDADGRPPALGERAGDTRGRAHV